METETKSIEYDEIFKVELITSSEVAWKILGELNCQAFEEMEDVFASEQEEVYALIHCAINCIHEIATDYHETHCPHICLALGEEFCREFLKVNSCRFFRDIQTALWECEDERMLKLGDVISVDFTEEFADKIGI